MTASTGTAPGRIFMSYRREEAAYPAAWLFDRLASHFGRDQVFKDVDSIEPGDDFVAEITTAVGSCEVLLTLIGSRWLTITDQDGHRRLDNPGDLVRLEVEAALTRNVRVIPILVDEARMPRADELPTSLAKLARRQALELSSGRFEADTQRLLRVLDRTIGEAQEEARQEAERAARHREKIEQSQRQIRERAAAQDWDAVAAVNDELAALDPTAADPDALASAAREQIARRHEAEEQARRDAGKADPVAAEPQPLPPRLEPSTTSVDFGPLTHHRPSPELSIRLGNAGGGSLNAHAATQASWIRVRQMTDELYVAVDTGRVGPHEGTVTIDSDGGSATILVRADIVAAPQAGPVTPASAEAAPAADRPAGPDRPHDTASVTDPSATTRARPAGETTRLLAHGVPSAARLVDTGFIILVVPLCIIAMEALIRPRTLLIWPWWVIVAASMLGIGITLGGVRQYTVPASILLCVMTWHTVYSLSVIGTSQSGYSNQFAVLSNECIVAAVVSVALCGWILVLLHKGIRNVNIFLAISMGCLSVALALAAVAFRTGRAGVWSAVGVITLAAAVGVILTLIPAHRPRSTSS